MKYKEQRTQNIPLLKLIKEATHLNFGSDPTGINLSLDHRFEFK